MRRPALRTSDSLIGFIDTDRVNADVPRSELGLHFQVSKVYIERHMAKAKEA